MKTNHYTKISIQKTLWNALLLFTLMCSFKAKAQECMLLPMTLQQRVQASPLIIEGEVLSQESFWNLGHTTIYTLNKVKVYKVFKGGSFASVIDVITEGGTVGTSRIVHSSTLSLSIGEMGVLMCIPNPYADSGVSGYTPYGSLAGFFKYDEDGAAHDPYHKYNTIETGLYNSIKNITNLPVVSVASNPKLNAITNKNAGSSGNANKQVGGGNQVDATPTITSFTPTSVASGIGTTITITGNNFNAVRGTGAVEFRNANDGGASWIRPLSTDYVSWSNTSIVVKVPSTNANGEGAGTGQIRVINSDASSNTATSAQTLTVTYAYSNLVYDNTARMATHVKDNTAGGYTFLIDQASFASVSGAVSKFSLVLDRWTCTSNINWLIGGNTNGGVADDGLNIACYSASLPASVLARCTSYYSGCGTTPFNWYVKEIDVAVKSNLPGGTSWYYGTGTPSGTQYDFETVMLHEVGHGHQLNHVIDAAAVMHYAVGAGETKRTLNAGDIAGSTFIKNRTQTVGGICGQSAMTLLTCGTANGAPIVNFSANRINITAGCSVSFTSEALPQATSWSWNFNGGATNSTLENPTVIFNTPGTYTVSLTASNGAGGTTTTRTNYIVVTPLTCSATLTNWSGSNADYNAPGGGKLVGHNTAGDLAFADKFLYCGTTTKLTQLNYYFNIHTGTGNITAKVWSADGAGGSPGTQLFSQTVPISTLATPTAVTIPSGLLVSSDYFIGFEIAYAGSDAVSLITNLQGEGAVNSAWRKSSGGVWDSFLNIYGDTFNMRIEAVINNAPMATITPGGPTTFCSGNNVLLSANTGAGLTYQWFNGVTNTGVTTPTYTATTSGSYTVRTTYSGCSTTSAATVVTVNSCASTNANLNNLVLSTGTLNPAFAQATISYTASVPNATTSITLTPTVADATATVKVNNVTVASGSPSGAIALSVGSNVITTVVTAQDGTTTKTYTVTVTRAASSNANLSNLLLSAGSLNPAFAQATTTYNVSVGLATTSTTVTPTVADATATIKVNNVTVASGSPSGSIALNVGPNEIGIEVTAQDGSTKFYTVTVMRLPSTNSSLSNLTISAGTLNPAFATGTTSYTASVSNATTSMTVTPTVSDATATVRVNGQLVASGSASQSITLNAGSNLIVAEVTAQDGTTITSYSITVTRAFSSNANLFGLALSSGTLNPVFAQATTDYTASVSNATTSISVTPTVADATATVTVNSVAVTSGIPSGSIPLAVGSNTITVVVTAQNGTTTKTYTVTVTRALSSNANLSNLVVNFSSLFPDFDPSTTDYDASVSYNTTSVTVTPTVADAGATVTVNSVGVTSGTQSGSIGLNVGDNTINATVTAADGSTKTYTIHLLRFGSSYLTNLVPSTGSLSPAFFQFTFNYFMTVINGINSISFVPTAEDATATIRVNGNFVSSGSSSFAIPLSVGNNSVSVQVDAATGGADFYNVNIVRYGPQNADLISLVPNSGTLNPTFASATTNYTIAVPAATTSMRFTPTAVAFSGSTITVNGSGVGSGSQSGNIALNMGVNVIPVVVTSQDASLTKTYTVTIYRGSNNADLSALSVGGGTLNPVFNPATTSYTVTVPNTQTATAVSPTVAVPGTVRVGGNLVPSGSSSNPIALSYGSNFISLTVTAQDGITTKEYSIQVFRSLSTDADLTNLVVSSGTLNPAFNSATTSYSNTVGSDVSSITVTPTRSSSLASITVNGQSVTSGSPSQSIPLNFGSNTITTVVTAQNGSTKTYTVNVNRPASGNAELSNLVPNSGSLTPAFAGATINYTMTVPHATLNIRFTPTVADPSATVKVNGLTVASGSQSQNISLSVGSNIILVVVTAQNGTTQTYTIDVERAIGSDPNLSDIFLNSGTLNPAFAQNTINYTASVSNATTSLLVAPFAVEATASITVNSVATPSGSFSQSIPLNVGANTITIVVTAQNGATKTYTVIVTRAADSNNDLSNLTVSTGSLTPSFDAGTLSYAVSVQVSTSSIIVTPTASSATSTITVNGNAVTSGSASGSIALSIGSNVITVVVTAQNGVTKTYTVNVTRASTSPTAVISGSTTVCSTNTTSTLTVNLTGTAPWNLSVSDGNLTDSYTVSASPFTFDVSPTSTATYTITALTDANTSAGPGDLTGSATVTVTSAQTYYADSDGDGFGNINVMQQSCTVPIIAGNPGVLNALDCDDTNPNLFMQFNFYVDADGDSFGAGPLESVCALDANTPPTGYSLNNEDCDDSNAMARPYPFYVDADGDTRGAGSEVWVCSFNPSQAPGGYSVNNNDCDDGNPNIYQNLLLYIDNDGDSYSTGSEVVCFGTSIPPGYLPFTLGSDCNDNDFNVHQAYSFYVDADNDFFGTGSLVSVCAVNANTPPTGYSTNNADCDDSNPNIYLSAPLYIDFDGDSYNAGSEIVCYGASIPPGYSSSSLGSDCDDFDALVFQGYPFYADIDGDGYGAGSAVIVCAVDANTPPAGYSLNNTDCDDTNTAVYQSAVLFTDFDGDGYDSGNLVVCYGASIPVGYTLTSLGADCDDTNPLIHQQFAFYNDGDGDGFGSGSSVLVCAMSATVPPAGYALNNTDCNDNDNTVYQSATLYVDADFDGFTSGVTQVVCYGASFPAGYLVSLTAIDCNDAIAAINPGAAEIPFNGIDDNCNGATDETGSVGITTTLLPTSCGTTLASIGSLIGIQTVSGHPITAYRIRATNGAQVQTIETSVPHFTMPQFASYAYATTYTIEIQLQRAGIWLPNWGAPCFISTPAILEQGGAAAISPSQCGVTLAKINTLIATTSIAGVTGYRFRVTNLTDPFGPNAVQTLDRALNWFSLQMLTRYNYGTTYRIEVAVKTTGDFGGYGAPCQVSSPAAPTLITCGGTVTSGTATVTATSLPGVTQYRFQVMRDSDGASTTIDRNTNWFNFNMVPAAVFTAGALYNVRVAVMTSGTWSPYGDGCQITAPGGTTKGISGTAQTTVDFRVAAYPSPFTADFSIDITTSSREAVELKVYDMLGKLIESKVIPFEELGLEKVGTHYPSGVYNVIVSQDGIVKTLRVVKR